jgi:hypothetical protein
MQFQIRDENQYKTSFRVPGSQYEFHVGAFCLHGMSSVLMCYMHSIFGRPILSRSFDAAGRGQPAGTRPGPPMLGRFVQVYCDDMIVDILIFSKTRKEHLVHVRMVLETLRHHLFFAKASNCQFGRSSVGFLGHVISDHGVAVDDGGSAKGRSCRRVNTAGLLQRRPPICRAGQLLSQVSVQLFWPRHAAHGPLQPPRSVLVRSGGAAELRRPPRGAHLGAGAPRMGPGPADAPADRRVGAGGIGHLGAAGRRWRVPPCRLRVTHWQADAAGALVPPAPAGAAGGGPRAQNASPIPPRQALRVAHRQRQPAMVAAAVPRPDVSHHQARWLNLLAEYQYRVVHIPGRMNPADLLTCKRFQDGQGPAERTGYADPDSEFELFTAADTAPATAFVHVVQRPDTPRCLHTDFAEAVRVALAADPGLSPIAAAAQAEPPGRVVESGRHCFILWGGLLYRRSRPGRGDRLCIPAAGELRRTVLTELHATFAAARPWLSLAGACGGRGCRRPSTSSPRLCHMPAR